MEFVNFMTKDTKFLKDKVIIKELEIRKRIFFSILKEIQKNQKVFIQKNRKLNFMKRSNLKS